MQTGSWDNWPNFHCIEWTRVASCGRPTIDLILDPKVKTVHCSASIIKRFMGASVKHPKAYLFAKAVGQMTFGQSNNLANCHLPSR